MAHASRWRNVLVVAAGHSWRSRAARLPTACRRYPLAQLTQANQRRASPLPGFARDGQLRDGSAKCPGQRAAMAGEPRPHGELPPAYFLAISGGGDNGAYGAGFLNGWTASGTRPEFKVVTGVSTGALIAPFAFLGPKYDYVLERVYTTTSQKDIFKKRGLVKGIFGDSMADTRPLANVISSYVKPELLTRLRPNMPRAGSCSSARPTWTRSSR